MITSKCIVAQNAINTGNYIWIIKFIAMNLGLIVTAKTTHFTKMRIPINISRILAKINPPEIRFFFK